jgi:hypothetical protein
MKYWQKAALGFLALATVIFAVSLFFPAANQICEHDQYSGKENCALYHLGPYALVVTAQFLKAYSDLIVAIATICIAAFTVILTNVTGTLAELTRDTLIFGNQATVFYKQIIALYVLDLSKLPAQRVATGWSFGPTWENSGNTPTKNLRTKINHELRDSKLPDNFPFVDNDGTTGSNFLGPKNPMRIGQTRAFSVAELQQVQAGKSFLYIWGWARYRGTIPGTPEYVSRYCVQVRPSGDVTNPDCTFSIVSHNRGNGIDDECIAVGLG